MPNCSVMFPSSHGIFLGLLEIARRREKISVPFCIKLSKNKNEVMLTGRILRKIKKMATLLEIVAVPILN